jgi:hypothetical protein
MTMIKTLLARLGLRMGFAGALVGAALMALWVAARSGRHAAEAEFAIRRAEARIRALGASKEVTHDIDSLPQAERDRRLDRWMRD